ncbi:hypothetical protein [uncultured Brevundimonas sp.]|uniref:hypothetical protein n=1 Tax=uncultured Brevundimonas sp. TaxID=213418 RepID=UPI002627467E|nr:hypothetical protein [uncultured Brevundimonas sp.]
MRRPFIEAAPLLAAHGRRFLPLTFRKGPVMADDVRFALIPRLCPATQRLDPAVKPLIFADADQLARAIQRRRDLRAIDMVDVEDIQLPDRAGPTRAVEVWALDAGNDRDGLIGYAYLDGRGQDALRAALARNPAVPTPAERAA